MPAAMNIWQREELSFGFVSTRFAGLDGVSLETQKWVDVLTSRGCRVYYMAGELDTDPAVSHEVPRAHFEHPDILEIQNELFVRKRRIPALSRRIQEIKEELKEQIYAFQRRFGFKILVVQNALAIPVNIPFGLALSEFIFETGTPTIAHHHDFYWERDRFNSAAAGDYLRSAFPPFHPSIQHVVINSIAGNELGSHTGASWTLIPNVLDFKSMPPEIDDYNRDFREAIGLEPDTLLVLQPTRVVSRKGIETSVELVKRLNPDKASLVITHKSGDEGHEYLMRIQEFVDFIGVDLRVVSDHIGITRGRDEQGRKVYTLADAYLNADLVAYPSLYEGYGNAFVETIYYRRPIVINRYPIFVADIEPKGFDVISINGYLTNQTVKRIKELIADPDRLEEMVETNYMLGWRYLSYEMLEEKFEQLLLNIFGA